MRAMYLIVALPLLGGCTGWSTQQSNTPAERRLPAAEKDAANAMAKWDLNRDGVFTCDELKQYTSQIFRTADRNNDGFVSAEEFVAIRQADPSLATADLVYFDGNNDGRLSQKEFVDKPNPFFARYDTNGDCRVTSEEIAAQRRRIDRDSSKKGKKGPPSR